VIISRIPFYLTCIAVFSCSVPWAEGDLLGKGTTDKEVTVPDRDITYSRENNEPDWKTDWDQARDLCRRGLSGQALVQYELVLQKKSTVDEARWEYTSLLMQNQRWQQAGKELDTLLAHEPGSRKFLLARAMVYQQEDQLEQAIKIYSQLYKKRSKVDNREVLLGFISALDRQGSSKAQLKLLEQLVRLSPGDLVLAKQLAELAMEVGEAEKVSAVLGELLQQHPDDVELLRLVARSQGMLGKPEQAAGRWQQVVVLLPADHEANEWLATYYQHKGNLEAALVHVERQLKNDPARIELILIIGRLYEQLDQPGQALDYLNFYLDIVPDDQKIILERDSLRDMMAAELITKIEHMKANLLWHDLETVTSDRAGVFIQVAGLLRTQGKKQKLIEMLLVLHQYDSDNPMLFQELLALLAVQGREGELLEKAEK